MAAALSESRRLLQKREKEIRSSIEKRAAESLENLRPLLASYRSACQDVIFQDYEIAQKENLENRLWEIHGKVNQYHRNGLKQFRNSNGKRKPVEQRKKEKSYLEFIKSSQQFYRDYIQRLNSRFGELKSLEAVVSKLSSPRGDLGPTTDNLQHLLLISCHQTLIRLGDLSRWRETQLQTHERRNWEPAKVYYDLANRINPGSAASNHQLAVISLQDMDHLETVYRLYLTVVAEEPHPSGQDNLEVEFRKIQGMFGPKKTQGEVAAQHDVQALTSTFLQLHVRYYKGVHLTEFDQLENEMIHQLAVNLREQAIDSILLRIVLVNIAAEYYAHERLRNDPQSPELQLSHFFLRRLNVRTFTALLSPLADELKKLGRKEPLTMTAVQDSQDVERLPIVIHRLLPPLRLYSSRMRADATNLFGREDDIARSFHIKEMWGVYVDALASLTSLLPMTNEIDLEYLLEEDECTLGLSPFRHQNLYSRYWTRDGMSQKPRKGDNNPTIRRHCDQKENVKRIFDLVDDGLLMQQQKVIPVHLASPHSGPVNAPGAEITHIDETTLPQPALTTHSNLVTMDIDTSPRESELKAERGQQDVQFDIQRTALSGNLNDEETCYSLLGSAAILERCEEAAVKIGQASTPLLPSIESSQFASRTQKYQSEKFASNLTHQGSSANWHQESQKAPPLQHQREEILVSSTTSSMPTPSFEQSDTFCMPPSKAKQHPSVRARQVQKALDASKFISSNIFPDDAHEPDSDG